MFAWIVAKDSPTVYVPHGSAIHPVRLLIIRAGITDQLRFRCPACARRCSILFLTGDGLSVIAVQADIVFKANPQDDGGT